MLFLHAGSLGRVEAHHHPNIGRLLTPKGFSRLADTLAAGYPVGVDNDGFKGVDYPMFARMLLSIRLALWGDLPTISQLSQHAGYPWPTTHGHTDHNVFGEPPRLTPPAPRNLLWVAVPDIVGDARKTYTNFRWLHPLMCDLPLAYVIQDGSGDVGVPWDAPNLRCLFLGGTDSYRNSSEMAEIAAIGKAQGLLIHGGRCNSRRRAHLFASLGCDSFDGTGASMYPKLIPEYLSWAAASV